VEENTTSGTTSPDETTAADGTETSEGTTVDEVDWQHVAELIGKEVAKHEPKFEVIQATHGGVTGELRIIHTATTGELLVSFLLICVLSTHLLRWLFKTVWGR